MRKNKWIPIKEGNPKKTGSYLVTLRTKLNDPSFVTWFYNKRSRMKAHGFNRGMKSAQRPDSAVHIYHIKQELRT